MANFLDEYRKKRTPGRTPEPFGGAAPESRAAALGAGSRVFCVQQHAARRMHHDLRLEWGGVLKSWAVPQGPSLDPADKRLAVQTEDHPIEYATFEGLIPAGEYGGGAMIVWDLGHYEMIGDYEGGVAEGKLLFDLHGYKLKGRFTLIKLKKSAKGNEWLLIKERDALVVVNGPPLPAQSVLTGRTVEELREGAPDPLLIACERAGAKKGAVDPARLELMLAESADKAFSKKGWLFELKYDGYRTLARKDGPHVTLSSRNGRDVSATFPDLVRALRALPSEQLLLDGEVVVLGDDGRPEFQKMQKRALLQNDLDVARMSVELPATYYAFDLLSAGLCDLRDLTLRVRKDLLSKAVPRLGPIRYTDHIEEHGELLYSKVQELGLEGMIAKRADSHYKGGRSPDWLKVRIEHTHDFAVIGFTLPKGARTGLGSLHLGGYRDGALIYAGRAGSGLSEDQLQTLRAALEADKRATPPCEPHPMLPKGREHFWVEPKLVCEVKYRQITEEGLLRQPTFVRMRDDKEPAQCELPGAAIVVPEKAEIEMPKTERKVELVNPGKIFWPDDGYTKKDLFDYYKAISPWLLPYLEDRPLVLTRYPDGIAGKSFFQKDSRGLAPPWMLTERIWSEDAQRDLDYFIANDVETLLYLANLGTIPLHIWASRTVDLGRPDWSILDLDPKTAPFEWVVKLARAAHDLCDEIGLPNYIKTSGQKGLHVLIPVGRQLTHDQSAQFAEVIAKTIEQEHPDISTTVRQVERRGGKVYLDYLQNGHGKTIASIYSARPVKGASVSMPLLWKEVNARLNPAKFTIKTAVKRMEKLGEDPFKPVLIEKPDLAGALARLQARAKR